MSKLEMIGCMDGPFESSNRVYEMDGLCPTISTCGGGNIQPKTIEVQRMSIDSKCLGGFGDKKSNGGTQWYQQDRVYSMGDVSLALPSQLPYGSYNYLEEKKLKTDDSDVKKIKIKQATKQGFIECEIGGGILFGISDKQVETRPSNRERTDKPDSNDGEYP